MVANTVVLFSTFYKGLMAAISISIGIAAILSNKMLVGISLILIGIYMFGWACALPRVKSE